MNLGEYDALLNEMNARVSYDNRPLPPYSMPPLPETGGTLTRAVAVDKVADDRWVVTYCNYNTPGAYTEGDDGSLTLSNPDLRYSTYQSNVALTKEKSGSGETSDTPRLLVVDAARADFPRSRTEPDDDATCRPFMPEPFIQQPPAAVPTSK
ncbi:hypothetical protein ACWIGI_39540 [Nocardia sp. NPDC055321]